MWYCHFECSRHSFFSPDSPNLGVQGAYVVICGADVISLSYLYRQWSNDWYKMALVNLLYEILSSIAPHSKSITQYP